MPGQLDILALEPFYGGMRRTMLELVVRCSRHRWTVLKLPPRRMERRLTAAAHWFAEQLTRHWVGRVDMLFTSDALNLADLYRLMPALMKKPAVVYFHSNTLPEKGKDKQGPHDLVNLSTATAANEIWFNSMYHLKSFLVKAGGVVDKYPELSGQNPMPSLTAKAHLMAPPVDLSWVREMGKNGIQKNDRLFFVDTRDADVEQLNQALATVQRRGEKFELVTVGPVEELSPDLPRHTVSETDDAAQIQAIQQAAVYISAKPKTTCDLHGIRALAAGCWPVVPKAGVYHELLPKKMHSTAMFDPADPENLASRLQDHWYLEKPSGCAAEVSKILKPFDAIAACRAIDERLEVLAKPGSGKG